MRHKVVVTLQEDPGQRPALHPGPVPDRLRALDQERRAHRHRRERLRLLKLKQLRVLPQQ